MLYLKEFTFVPLDTEEQFLNDILRTCYDSFYPFGVLGKKLAYETDPYGRTDARHPKAVEFAPVTIFYGGNGCGKTTALNIIAEKIGAERDALYNSSSFFGEYLSRCGCRIAGEPAEKRIITSDDVFDFMLNLRSLNEGVDSKREDLFREYLDSKYSSFRMRSLEDYEQLKKTAEARRGTQSRYIRKNLMGNVREHSNGESAFLYFTGRIREKGLYLLDEPENSLAPARQAELAEFLENSARFFDCQIIMATHSPFLLSMKDARIYDLDETPLRVKPWTKLASVRAYYDFFKDHRDDFEQR